MSTHAKLTIAALLSSLLLAVAVGSACASRLSISETHFKIIYSPLSFIPSFGGTTRCPVTLEGSFHSRTSSKVAGALAGFITSTTVGPCEAGRARVDTETLPWHIQYTSFAGTLPNITSIDQTTLRPSWEISGEIVGLRVTCRYTLRQLASISDRESRGIIVDHRPGAEASSSETEGCPEGRHSGTGAVKTPSGGTIRVTLI